MCECISPVRRRKVSVVPSCWHFYRIQRDLIAGSFLNHLLAGKRRPELASTLSLIWEYLFLAGVE